MRATTLMLEHLPDSAAPKAEQTMLNRLWREAEQRVAETQAPQPPVSAKAAEPAVSRVRFNHD
ncbi:MAG: hypothetical protein RKP20_17400 [Candidatus Competibacter sp.]|nr:hypothetical protein [Candidatus Competibacter sp.]